MPRTAARVRALFDTPAFLDRLDAAIWLTGLPCAGKSTIAAHVAAGLAARGATPLLLDGDALRASGSADLGFSVADRHEQCRRAGHAAHAALERGEVPIVALVSPYRSARAQARAIIGPSRFLEVHVDAPAWICEARDVKGHYAAARRGRITAFTGISDPYEPPRSPHLRLDTTRELPEQSAARVLALLSGGRRFQRADRVVR